MIKFFKHIRSNSKAFNNNLMKKQTKNKVNENINGSSLSLKTIHFILTSEDQNEYNEPSLKYFNKGGLESYLVEKEALRYGLNVRRFSHLLFDVTDFNGKTAAFYWSSGQSTPLVALKILQDKHLTRRFLEKKGIQVPKGRSFLNTDLKGAIRYSKTISTPCVLKLNKGTGGVGVITNIVNENELKLAWHELSKIRKQKFYNVIVEEQIEGDDYRFLVVGGKVVSVIKKIPANIIGDGKTSLERLVFKKNQQRESNPYSRLIELKLNKDALLLLEKNKLTQNTIPQLGQIVFLTSVSNMGQGGDSVSISLNEIHPSIITMAEKAVGAIPGISHAGVDFIISDCSLDLKNQKAAICEINSVPDKSFHHFPNYGTPINVSKPIFESNAKISGLYFSKREKKFKSISVTIKHIGSADAIVDELKEMICLSEGCFKIISKKKGCMIFQMTGNYDSFSAAITSLFSSSVGSCIDYIEKRPEINSIGSSIKFTLGKLYRLTARLKK